jgi:hypothetical protein
VGRSNSQNSLTLSTVSNAKTSGMCFRSVTLLDLNGITLHNGAQGFVISLGKLPTSLLKYVYRIASEFCAACGSKDGGRMLMGGLHTTLSWIDLGLVWL